MSSKILDIGGEFYSGMLSCLPMDEGAGTPEDLIDGSRSITLTGASWSTFDGRPCIIVNGGAGDVFELADSTDWGEAGDSFTIAALLRIEETGSAWFNVFSHGWWPGKRLNFAGWSGDFNWGVRSTSNTYSGTDYRSTSDWVLVVGTYDDANLEARLMVRNVSNGDFNGATFSISDSTSINSGSSVVFGGDSSTTVTVGGYWFWKNRILTPTEVDTIGDDFDVFYTSISGPEALTGQTGSYNYSGDNAEVVAHRQLNTQPGEYNYSADNADLIAHRLLSGNSGTYNYSGNNADLITHKLLTGNAGAYNYGSNQAVLALHRLLQCNEGVYSYGSDTADLIKHLVLVVNEGAYNYDSNDAILTINTGNTLTGLTGEYSYTGQQAELLIHRKLNGETGAYRYGANTADLLKRYKLTGQSANFVLGSNDAEIIAHRLLQGQAGSYEYDSGNASLVISADRVTITMSADTPIIQTLSRSNPVVQSISTLTPVVPTLSKANPISQILDEGSAIVTIIEKEAEV